MALLVDGDINSLGDLREWDSSILDTADGERIDLNAKLRRAQAEVEEEIERFLREQERGTLDQVVVDRALRHWHALKTLEATYRDAYFNQLNDRYGEKWKLYLSLAERQEERYFDAGVAIVFQPLRRPAELEASLTEGELAPTTYRLQATAVDGMGRESAPSPVQVVSSPVPHSLEVRLPWLPAGASGWNIYAGSADGPLALQNDAPLAGAAVWRPGREGLRSGRPPGDGQPPDEVIRAGGSVLLRG
ncbi:MAG: hypothetical protein NZR01_05040 [Bryobacteraceae bacterium]|nr:hypothetical protein [Bryobacteraceae bacterium]